MPKMELERFKEEAEEQLKDIRMDPAIQARILFRIREEETVKDRHMAPWRLKAGMAAFGAAAAALVFLFSTGVIPLPGSGAKQAANGTGLANANRGQELTIAADTREIPQGDNSAMEFGVFNLQEYHEGYAAAQNEKGLWGFVDEEYNWVVDPIYEEVSAVENGTASVRLNGKTERITVKK